MEFAEKDQKYQRVQAELRKDNQALEAQLVKSKQDHFDLKRKADQQHKKIVALESENEGMFHRLRSQEAMISDLQGKLEETLERLSILQVEAQGMKEVDETEKARFKLMIEEMQEEMLVNKRKRRPSCAFHSKETYAGGTKTARLSLLTTSVWLFQKLTIRI
jgi:hypothetical protein